MGYPRSVGGPRWIACVSFTLACARSGEPEPEPEPIAADRGPSDEVFPTGAQVCAHLMELRRRRHAPEENTLATLDVCAEGLDERAADPSVWRRRWVARLHRCILAARTQVELSHCDLFSFRDYGARAPNPRSQEAWNRLAAMVRAMNAYALADDEHGEPRWTCPGPGGEIAVGPVPRLSMRCEGSERSACTPTPTPVAPHHYADDAWSDPTWSAIDFAIDEPHRLHYALRFDALESECQFTAQAFGDLDDDGIWATYEIAGAVDSWGPIVAVGMYIDREDE